MFTRQVAVDQLGRLIVASTAFLNLVNLGNRGRKIIDLVDLMWSSMAVNTPRLTAMYAAPY
jgi:hypothetical protein